MDELPTLNGAKVIERRPTTIFVRLPRELWRSVGRCDCSKCNGAEGFWDTLAIAADPSRDNYRDYAWTVHHPD